MHTPWEIISDPKHEPVLFAVPFFVLFIILELVALKYLDNDEEPKKGYSRPDTISNFASGLGSVIINLAARFAALFLYVSLWSIAPWHLDPSNPWTWVGTLLAVDLLWYAYHRASHRVRILWAAHQAHHSSVYFNYSVALRQKWNPWGELIFWIPLPLLGVPPWMIFFAFSLNLIYQFWVHTETIPRLWKPIEFIFNTPSHHRVHHASQEQYLDRNYGGILIVWDRLFGSYAEEKDLPIYGLTVPVTTHNPFRLQYGEFAAAFRDVRTARSWRDRRRLSVRPARLEARRIGSRTGIRSDQPLVAGRANAGHRVSSTSSLRSRRLGVATCSTGRPVTGRSSDVAQANGYGGPGIAGTTASRPDRGTMSMMSNKQYATARRFTALLAAVAVALAACSSGDPGAQDETVTVTSSVQAPDSDSGDTVGSDESPVTTDSVTTASGDEPTESRGSETSGSPTTEAESSTSPTEPATSTAATSATSSAPETSDANAKPTPDTSKDTEVWDDNSMVSHIFFHSLIVDPERAFSDPESGAGYLDYMATQDEFAKVMQQVYDNGYVLVSPHQLATVNDDGTVAPKELKLPKGKKPLVLSIDDVSYYEYMEGDGFATDLFVAENGRVLNHYTDADGKTHEGSFDVMPMVDDFVREHPDFSHDGARGVIALTGYNGVLGYRSSPSEYAGKNPNLDADIATAKGVAQALKEEGWEFASHSWGHINFTNSSLGSIQADTEKWKSDVEPIVGPTDLLIYPFGADISGVPGYSGEKFEYLKSQGYSFFFNVDGSTPAWGQWGDRYLREARINIDGISLKAAVDGREVLNTFFDPKSVIDPARPASISGSG